jgi:hypothetical protein
VNKIERAKLIRDIADAISVELMQHGPAVMSGVAAHITGIWLAGITPTDKPNDRQILWNHWLRELNNQSTILAEHYFNEFQRMEERNEQ